jgi:hypothetical protein
MVLRQKPAASAGEKQFWEADAMRINPGLPALAVMLVVGLATGAARAED